MHYFLNLGILLGCCFFMNACSSTNQEVLQNNSTDLEKWLSLAINERPSIHNQSFAIKNSSKKTIATATQLLYEEEQKQQTIALEKSWKEKTFNYQEYNMPFKIKTFGKVPKDGRSLFISMHGGGGAAPEVNDQQWENQIRLYQPQEGVYIAPRAPTNTWNLWHQAHIDDLFDQLIKAAVLFAEVNPNKVYLTGYSAGGDGTFQLAPRMADRFAAAAMMAGHPNETTPDGLRNLPFALFMGELDGAYKRNQYAKDWKILLDSLQQLDTNGYIHNVQIVADKGHWMDRADTSGINWMTQFTRKTLPTKIIWKQDDRHHDCFYWLRVPKDKIETGKRIIVERQQNTINILENYSPNLYIQLNDEMVNLDKSILIKYQGKIIFEGIIPRKIQTVYQSISNRMDKNLVFCSEVLVIDNKQVTTSLDYSK